MHVCCICVLVTLYFFPPPAFFSGRPRGSDDQEYDYPSEDQFTYCAELPGKQPPPLDHPYIAHSFSPVLALDLLLLLLFIGSSYI